MKRVARLGLAALFAFPALIACEDREVSLQVVNVAPLDLGSCGATTDETIFLGNGVVDLALARDYAIFARITNNMFEISQVKNYTVQDARLETNDVVLNAAVIEFSALDQITANLPEKVRVPITGTVALNGSATIPLQVLSPAMLQELRSSREFRNFDAQNNLRPIRGLVKIIAKLQIEGETLDGKSIQSNQFLFPIDVCNGCRVSFPAVALAVDANTGAQFCLSPAELGEAVADLVPPECPGFVGTDGVFIDCVQCRGAAIDSVAAQLCNPPVSP